MPNIGFMCFDKGIRNLQRATHSLRCSHSFRRYALVRNALRSAGDTNNPGRGLVLD
jgi:hypothetical protein